MGSTINLSTPRLWFNDGSWICSDRLCGTEKMNIPLIIHLNPIFPLLATVTSQLPEKSFPSRSRGWFVYYCLFGVFCFSVQFRANRHLVLVFSGHQRKLTLTWTVIQIFSALVICLKNSKLAIYLPMLLSFALSGYSSNGLSSVGVGKTTAIDPHSHLRQPGMKMNYDVAGFVHNDKREIEFRNQVMYFVWHSHRAITLSSSSCSIVGNHISQSQTFGAKMRVHRQIYWLLIHVHPCARNNQLSRWWRKRSFIGLTWRTDDQR